MVTFLSGSCGWGWGWSEGGEGGIMIGTCGGECSHLVLGELFIWGRRLLGGCAARREGGGGGEAFDCKQVSALNGLFYF